jgi:hypothetical protein
VSGQHAEPDDWYEADSEPGSSVATILVLAIALLLLLAAFVWFMIRIDPLLTDFIERDTATPTASSRTESI